MNDGLSISRIHCYISYWNERVNQDDPLHTTYKKIIGGDKMEANEVIFLRINECLLNEKRPSILLDRISDTETFQTSDFSCLNRMKLTEQSRIHHPEGNVWIHTMMVVDYAAKLRYLSKEPSVLMWAAYLHDIGKPEATKYRRGKITAYDHDRVGAIEAERLLKNVCKEDVFVRNVCAMIRWHMQILFVAKHDAVQDLECMKEETDIEELALLGLSDRMGRLGVDEAKVIRDITRFVEKAYGSKANERDYNAIVAKLNQDIQ